MHTNFELETSPGQLKARLLGLGIQAVDRVRNGCPGKTIGIEKDARLSQEQAERKTNTHHQNARAHLRARLPFSSSALQPNPHTPFCSLRDPDPRDAVLRSQSARLPRTSVCKAGRRYGSIKLNLQKPGQAKIIIIIFLKYYCA